ncbi:MAG: hypothetical protein UIT70_06330 [Clostridia bacterium]|jgi:hypothetical protein|nr:hypothetical protein [Clostridia bacterium]
MSIEELRDKYNIKIDDLEEFTRIQVREDESPEFYQELAEYVKNCRTKISIANGIIGNATREDFLQGEKIIEKIVKEIQPNWSKKQIIAYVHYKIGELISYVPDFKFNGMSINSANSNDTRNIWKSLINGKSVCNGITAISRNILARVGVSTRELSSSTHSFLLAETEEGNIITDPTWDLKNTLYGARPMYFGKTYEQLREQEEGLSNAHKLESPPENVIEVPEEELREIYYTLGYTREDRTFIFPILDRVSEIKENRYENEKERLNAFFDMFSKEFSKEATHLSETRTILESCLYEFGIEPKDLHTKFIYKKEDKDCNNPYLILLINDEQQRDQLVYYLDSEIMQFRDMNLTDLDNKYKIHDLDTSIPFWKKYLSKDEKENNEIER